jgi:hypothetical protein
VKEEQVIDTDGKPLTKVTYYYGTVEYRNDKGQRHRIGGPALICSDGTQEYYMEGKIHRTDGPAQIFPNGKQYYYVEGDSYTKDEYPQAVLAYKMKQMLG